ncbi:MAG: aldo/keto reductase [Clostridia bacterium]|jgi:aryl-alcohol dehydrogenase-like predicted oxidoreductase|nr:aldo/keto reductase [Clostridia bacterium]
MEYRFLGNTGLKVSELAFGTQTFGWGADQKTAHALADLFVEAGGNLFDTADSYNSGLAESMLGSWLKARKNRHSVIVATKVFFPTGDGPNDAGASRKHILHSINESLGRLKTDYVDLYQIHCFDLSTPLEETLSALDDLVRAGKVRYMGASNYTASQLEKALMLSEIHQWESFSALQAEYSLIVRSTEWELLPLCREEGVGFLAWSPVAGGWLTGKYGRNQPPPSNSRVGRKDRWDDQPEQRENELTWRVIDNLIEIGKDCGKTAAQIALNWILQQPGITASILGVRTLEQLKENLGCTGWQLSEEQMNKLKKASDVPLPYPYRFIERYTRRR